MTLTLPHLSAPGVADTRHDRASRIAYSLTLAAFIGFIPVILIGVLTNAADRPILATVLVCLWVPLPVLALIVLAVMGLLTPGDSAERDARITWAVDTYNLNLTPTQAETLFLLGAHAHKKPHMLPGMTRYGAITLPDHPHPIEAIVTDTASPFGSGTHLVAVHPDRLQELPRQGST